MRLLEKPVKNVLLGILDIKHKKEVETAHTSLRIYKERTETNAYKDVLLKYWEPADKDHKQESLKRFIFDLCDALHVGEDMKPILDKAPLDREGNNDVGLLVSRLVIQEIVIDRMTGQFEELMHELKSINKTLHNAYALLHKERMLRQ